MCRRWLLSVVLAGVLLMGPAAAAARSWHAPAPSLTVTGAVATATTYSLSQLQALPQTTFTVTRTSRWSASRTDTDQGVPVETLVNAAQPTLPAAKNALLRVTVEVSSEWGRSVTFALGELDSGFGNHPADLAVQENGHRLAAPELVVPGDTVPVRTLDDVDRIAVAVQNPSPTTPPTPGALTIEDGPHTAVLSAAELGGLPAQTLNVTFQAGTATQQHVETGPTLQAVLRVAHIRAGLDTWVAAVGSDGYVATVTPAEAWVGGRPLLISLSEDGTALTQPRLVTDGDVKGGRYVSGVVDLVVGQSQNPGRAWQTDR
ncbi:MAG TPA: hypothetical protein VEF89_02295 [Solirubrobacteraceae bacterium]|nr:hypothetical protein [Solirubrobacteraceae bacterium]